MSEGKQRVCDECVENTLARDDDGRYGKFLHASCFDVYWRSEYGDTVGPYYSWMRQGLCAE